MLTVFIHSMQVCARLFRAPAANVTCLKRLTASHFDELRHKGYACRQCHHLDSEACPRTAILQLLHSNRAVSPYRQHSHDLICHRKSVALDVAMSCRYVVIDNYVSREVAARSRSEVLNVFRQGEAPPCQSWSVHSITDVLMHAGHCAHCHLHTFHFQSVCTCVCQFRHCMLPAGKFQEAAHSSAAQTREFTGTSTAMTYSWHLRTNALRLRRDSRLFHAPTGLAHCCA